LKKAFMDGSFAPARGVPVWKTMCGRGTKIMAVADGAGLPVAVCAESATPHEVTLVLETLAEIFVAEPIERLVGDNAYDSDRLDRELAETWVEMLAPSKQLTEPHPEGPSSTSLPPTTIDDRTALCLASELPPPYSALATSP
jgi:hypothetical protein